ncbi:MAG: error-prone DNA polymerase [Chthoniobacterales bacterium]|nr:error-prone DNA polymerase [Chthoniobacterales bacterium]
MRYARSRGILCQGRGSAANSAVCYCLGVTAVDPAKFQLVFERFASSARAEPPDIDIDFEHERREEVIQYVYQKYGRDRAAMTGSLITYRGRSAIRDVGKALGFSQDMLDTLAGKLDWWHSGSLSSSQLDEAGVDAAEPTIRQLVGLTTQLLGFPRHLSQHVGGMIISRSPLCELVPIENAAMEDRTVIEWDKDDLDVLQMFKVDILALGMLTCLSKGLKLVNSYSQQPPLELHTIPHEDPQTYEMASDADTVGVFQIESRAQMSMLPRLQPRKFYDLVIEVAIVRPGPIQGKMVHPYLQRREQQRRDPTYKVIYPKPELEGVLRETLGVPLFQEQAMRLAIIAAGFTPEEADSLRRAMAAWKRGGGILPFHEKFVGGMLRNGYDEEFAERCFEQISGFGEYGFPESHAASFAILVYASAWLKRHHPAAFAAGLLNSQPMGFYAPAQLVRDAREHGVEVRAVDVNASLWDCMLEHDVMRPHPATTDNDRRRDSELLPLPACGEGAGGRGKVRGVIERGSTSCVADPSPLPSPRITGAREFNAGITCDPHDKRTWGLSGPALRLGFRQIKGLKQSDCDRLISARERHGTFTSVEQFHRITGLSTATVRRLVEADAFLSIGKSRRLVAWDAMALDDAPAPLVDRADFDRPPSLALIPPMPAIEEVLTDYSTVGLSLKQHPVSFAREALSKWKIQPALTLHDAERSPHGRWVKVAGLVLVRQRPGTASGVVFITLEDETGTVNLILWSSVYEQFRRAARYATLLQADGYVQREGKVVHVLAKRLFDRSELLHDLAQPSRDFH